ncbi:hypothetical protein HDU67_005251 [Dinochytrium kinnereticum]|nr:hypothetical protein HDU67_005251 [Dinochytrium kinnereticum]
MTAPERRNFSFSLALAKLLWPDPARPLPLPASSTHPALTPARDPEAVAREYLGLKPGSPTSDVTILSTSFDSREQLLAKYPESRDILVGLEKFSKNVLVRHGVNAWELASFYKPVGTSDAANPDVKGQVPDWTLGQREDGTVGFDAIVWNHPHLGTEDFRLHRFLMAHFFRSVSEVLRRPDPPAEDGKVVQLGGCVVVSLVRGQETRWNLVQEASRSELGLTADAPFLFEEGDWDGYVVKRNKHGRSFKNEQTRKHVGTDMRSHGFRFRFGQAAVAVLEPQSAQDKISETLAATLTTTNSSPSVPQPSSIAVAAGAKKPGNAITAKDLKRGPIPPDMKCQHCGRQLTSPRAYRQHVHQIHVLKQLGEDWKPDRPASLPCDVEGCAKSFTSEDARWQHRVNKHSTVSMGELPPVGARGGHDDGKEGPLSGGVVVGEEEGGDDYDYVPCDVCGQAVARRTWGMMIHLETLKPAVGLDMGCPICSSTFIERRALFQHFKFCRLKHKAVLEVAV